VSVYEIVQDVAQRLAAADIRFLIGGSLASSVWGQPRQTNDADFALVVSHEDVEALVESFADPYYVSASSIQEAIEDSQPFRSFQILHMDEVFKIDAFVLLDTDYSRSEIERRRFIKAGTEIELPYASPENTVINKLRWYDLGNRVSDRQWNDIVQVLEVQKGRLDEGYLDLWTEHFGLRDLLDEARSQTFD
jgi:hypothetical protein